MNTAKHLVQHGNNSTSSPSYPSNINKCCETLPRVIEPNSDDDSIWSQIQECHAQK